METDLAFFNRLIRASLAVEILAVSPVANLEEAANEDFCFFWKLEQKSTGSVSRQSCFSQIGSLEPDNETLGEGTIMKKYVMAVGVVASLVAGLCGWVSRMPRQVEGYARATAETAADRVANAIPDAIHDRKLDNEVSSVRQEIIDRTVQMNLSKRQIEQLETEVSNLEGSVERRKRLLVEAYPVLKAAIDGQQKTVKFANQEHTLADFQKEIDDLLSMQDRETRQVEIKRVGLTRLKKSAEEGELALGEMKRALDQTEQEVVVLRSRRDQAEVESSTLDLVSSATANRETVGTVMNDGLARLKGKVNEVEARNEARRGMTSLEQRPTANSIGRQWNRLESLKAIHDTAHSDDATVLPTDVQPPKADNAASAAKPITLDASKVTISIEGSQPGK